MSRHEDGDATIRYAGSLMLRGREITMTEMILEARAGLERARAELEPVE